MITLAATLTLATAPLDRTAAKQLATAAAERRLSNEARRRGVHARLRLDERTSEGWMFRAAAIPACLPGQAVCSNLIGHFTVRRTGDVVDADTGEVLSRRVSASR